MGILPNRRMYWAPSSKVSIIADTMSRNRFHEILRDLHFNDNTLDLKKNDPSHNKLFKIQPLIAHFCKAFQSLVLPETFMSVYEMMMAFKGGIPLKFICPRNLPNWGTRCSVAREYQDIHISLKYLEVKVHQVRQQTATPHRARRK